MLYITNQHNYFFTINIKLDLALLEYCTVHANEETMLKYVCEKSDLDRDEVGEPIELRIVESELQVTSINGHWYPAFSEHETVTSTEELISYFEV